MSLFGFGFGLQVYMVLSHVFTCYLKIQIIVFMDFVLLLLV